MVRWNVTQFPGSCLAQPDHFSSVTPARKPSAHSQGTIPSSSGDRIPHSNSRTNTQPVQPGGCARAQTTLRENSTMRIPTLRPTLRQQVISAALLCVLAFLAISGGEAAPAIDRDAILSHLNAIISWYRDSGSKIQSVGLPSDAIYQDTSQNLTQQAVRLAFQAAQAAAVLVNASDQTNAPASPAASSGSTQQQNLAQTLATLKSRIDQDQSKLDALNKQIASAPSSKRQSLSAQRDSIQGEIALDQATLDAVQKLATFVENSEESGVGGFSASINDLGRSVL